MCFWISTVIFWCNLRWSHRLVTGRPSRGHTHTHTHTHTFCLLALRDERWACSVPHHTDQQQQFDKTAEPLSWSLKTIELNALPVCTKYSSQLICRTIFWSLTRPNGCCSLVTKAVLSGVECGSELYCFQSQGLPLALCIAPTPHAVSGARPTLVVGSGSGLRLSQSPQD